MASHVDLFLMRPATVCALLTAFLMHVGCAVRTPVDAPALSLEPLPAEASGPYRLQAGDLIAIKFWGVSELDEEQRIRPDGAISLPYVDEVPAAGLTPQQLDDRLTDLYSTELTRPNLTVIVREAVEPRIYIGGEVGIQGTVAWTRELTLFQAIQASGGFLTSARRKQVILIRQQPDGKPIARSVNLLPVLSGGNPAADVRLAARDVIYVPRTKIANVNLFISQYIDDVIPLQSVVSGALLADVTGNSNSSSNSTTSGTTTGGGNP